MPCNHGRSRDGVELVTGGTCVRSASRATALRRAAGARSARSPAARGLLELLRRSAAPRARSSTRASACGPPSATTASQKRRPTSYWRSFSSSPSSRSSTRQGSPRVLAPAVHRGAQARQRGQHLGADRVHRVLGVPLDQRHRRLHPLDQRQRSSPSVRRSSSPRRARSTMLAQLAVGVGQLAAIARQPRPSPRRRLPPSAHLQPVDQLLQHAAEVLAQPRRAGELHGVGDLVDRHPQHQLVAVDAEVARGLREVRREQQQARRHRRRRAARGRTGRARAGRACPVSAPTWAPSSSPETERSGPASGPVAVAEALASSGAEQRAHRLQVGGDPGRAVDDLERRQLARQRAGRCSRSRAARSRARSGSTAAARTPPCGGEPATSSPIRWAVPQSIASTDRA